MLYLVTGASGSGKTACLNKLRVLSADVSWHDFDDVGVPTDADKVWRQRTTEYWLKRAIQNQSNGRDTARVQAWASRGKPTSLPEPAGKSKFIF